MDKSKWERPETLKSTTTKVKTGYGNVYVTVSELNGKPFEVFATVGKSGRSIAAKTEAIGRLVSLALQYGIELDVIADQLVGIAGERPTPSGNKMYLSIPDAIGQVLKRYSTGGV